MRSASGMNLIKRLYVHVHERAGLSRDFMVKTELERTCAALGERMEGCKVVMCYRLPL
jgi:hypothetical protein